MLQYVQVNFESERDVYVDGEINGTTNSILRLDEATYTFTLGDPQNYQPPSIVAQVSGTTPVTPMQIDFTPAAPTPAIAKPTVVKPVAAGRK